MKEMNKNSKFVWFPNEKKAWLRIVEATIASLIVISAIVFIVSRQQVKTSDISDDIYEKQRYILDIISQNEDLRKDILIKDNTEINNTISKMIPENWGFSTKICRIDEICNGETPNDREIYATETIITSSLSQYQPKKLRFFVWMR